MSNLNSSNSFFVSNSNIKFHSNDSDEAYKKKSEKKFLFSKAFNLSDSYDSHFISITSTKSSSEKLELEEISKKAAKKADYLVSLSVKEEFVEGEVSAVEIYLESLYSESPVLFLETFQKCWLKLYTLDNALVLADFISIVSSIDYEWLKDKADVLVLSGCAHTDPYVNEATLRAIEAWEQPAHIDYLNNVRPFELDWLEEYRVDVTRHIEECNELFTS